MGDTDAELDRLSDLLHGIPTEREGMTIGKFDGYVAALIVSPEMVPPSEWLPGVWGRDGLFAHVAEAETLVAAMNPDLIHKVGVTTSKVETRIAGARLEPTFLMADVEIVASYKLYNIDRAKLEKLIHRIFAPARLDIEIEDRSGNPVVPREWFLAPLDAIDDAVEKIREGTITRYRYDATSASLVARQ